MVDGVVNGDVGVEGDGEEGGEVGVVHEICRAVAVDFVGVDGAVNWVREDGVALDASVDGGGEAAHPGCCAEEFGGIGRFGFCV